MSQLVMDRLHALLAELSLQQSDALLESTLERAAKEEPSYADFLLDVLTAEKEFRTNRILQTRTRMASLPYIKTLAQFDFAFQPSVDERQVKDLQTLRFVSDHGNVILLGPPGVGKTHLAVGLAVGPCAAVSAPTSQPRTISLTIWGRRQGRESSSSACGYICGRRCSL